MLRIAVIFFIVLLLPDIYIYRVHIARMTKRRSFRLLYGLPTLLLAAAYVVLMTSSNAMSHNAQGIGRLAVITLLIAFPKLLFMLCSLMGLLLNVLTSRLPFTVRRSPFNTLGLALGLVGFCIVLYGAVVGNTRFEVKEVEYRSADLPRGFDGYRIVQISDIHVGSWAGNPEPMRRLVERVNAQEADLIVFTGDLVNQRADELEGFQEILSKLHAPDGVYSILGNHDYGSYYRWPTPEAEQENLAYLIRQEEAMGWKMLNNSHAIIRHRGDSLALVGVENDGEPPFSQYADLPKALQGTDGMFRILLSHNPTHWRREVLPATDIPLMLAGHTHAMQIVLFGHSLAETVYPEWSGMYREGSRALYVNIGIGYVGLPFRFGAWPEITVMELKVKN